MHCWTRSTTWTRAGIEVRWPADVLFDPLEREVVASASALREAGCGQSPTFDSLIEVDWRFLLEGTALTRKGTAGPQRGQAPPGAHSRPLDPA